jgi:hypothetical protein
MTRTGNRSVLAPEFQLLCLAARPNFDDDARQALNALIRQNLDWGVVLRGVRRHRVAFLVRPRLRADMGLSIPTKVEETLSRLVTVNTRRALAQTAEVCRLIDRLTAMGVRAIILKGVALAASLYGNIAARGVGDIDLLVAPDDFRAAGEALTTIGYVPDGGSMSEARFKAEMRGGKDWTFRHPETGAMVELHHRLVGSRTLLATNFDNLWRARAETRLGSSAVPCLSFPMLPLYLCVHGDWHNWDRLQWLIDLERCFAATQDDDLLAFADGSGSGGSMRRAMALGRDWLGSTSFGAQAVSRRAQASADRFVERLFGDANWLQEPSPGSVAHMRRSFWRRYHRWETRDRWRDIWEDVALESHRSADWDIIPLPEQFTWLYPWLRPIGLLLRHRTQRKRACEAVSRSGGSGDHGRQGRS